jgi:hypothetical protein
MLSNQGVSATVRQKPCISHVLQNNCSHKPKDQTVQNEVQALTDRGESIHPWGRYLGIQAED